MFNYSENLMNRYQEYMEKYHGILIEDDTAHMHLESFATLFLALRKPIEEE
jgi:hypothetical protein